MPAARNRSAKRCRELENSRNSARPRSVSAPGLRQATISSIESGDAGTQLKTLTSVLATLGLELVVQPREGDDAVDLEEIF